MGLSYPNPESRLTHLNAVEYLTFIYTERKLMPTGPPPRYQNQGSFKQSFQTHHNHDHLSPSKKRYKSQSNIERGIYHSLARKVRKRQPHQRCNQPNQQATKLILASLINRRNGDTRVRQRDDNALRMIPNESTSPKSHLAVRKAQRLREDGKCFFYRAVY
jgi:hypothetical protein